MNLPELPYLHLNIQACCLVFFNKIVMNFMQVKELRPPLASMSPFYPTTCSCTANVNRQTADKLLFSYAIITGENV